LFDRLGACERLGRSVERRGSHLRFEGPRTQTHLSPYHPESELFNRPRE
jgi:hypothetical protein